MNYVDPTGHFAVPLIYYGVLGLLALAAVSVTPAGQEVLGNAGEAFGEAFSTITTAEAPSGATTMTTYTTSGGGPVTMTTPAAAPSSATTMVTPVTSTGTPITMTTPAAAPSGVTIVSISGNDVEFSNHALDRLNQRGVDELDARDIISRNRTFNYWHDGKWKTGVYDYSTQIFMGIVNGLVTTAMVDVTKSYVDHLKKARPPQGHSVD